MRLSSLFVALALETLPMVLADAAYGFTADTFLIYEGQPIFNHPSSIGYVTAVNSTILINPTEDNPTTYCPPKLAAANRCPQPNPPNVKTQFNTTAVQGGKTATVHMNSADFGSLGKQRLYVAHDGLLKYTAPGGKLPSGAHNRLFSLEGAYIGSQLSVPTPTLHFNGSLYFYSCPSSTIKGSNLTYAQVPNGKNVTGCLPVVLYSVVYQIGNYPDCPYANYTGANPPPPLHCERAAYEYI